MKRLLLTCWIMSVGAWAQTEQPTPGLGDPANAGYATPLQWGVTITGIVLLAGGLWWAAHRRRDDDPPSGN